ncbi:hypothetical protein E3N88_32285 [Mikania micrantha]|uniref:Uncharacterized protein n=1 Tax=Mikania micrantha TaxID=192012 RepID=A0A5N6M8L3_9ASTR|nr:hypothetical protein E3N88_32285 [Mikania micrantha]
MGIGRVTNLMSKGREAIDIEAVRSLVACYLLLVQVQSLLLSGHDRGISKRWWDVGWAGSLLDPTMPPRRNTNGEGSTSGNDDEINKIARIIAVHMKEVIPGMVTDITQNLRGSTSDSANNSHTNATGTATFTQPHPHLRH